MGPMAIHLWHWLLSPLEPLSTLSQWNAIGSIFAIGTTGIIGAIGTPHDPFTMSGDREWTIAIEWFHYNGSKGRHGDRHWRQWNTKIGVNGDWDHRPPLAPLTSSPLAPHTFVSWSGSIGANGANCPTHKTIWPYQFPQGSWLPRQLFTCHSITWDDTILQWWNSWGSLVDRCWALQIQACDLRPFLEKYRSV